MDHLVLGRVSKKTVIYEAYIASSCKKIKKIEPIKVKLNLKRLHLRNEMIVGDEKVGKISRWKIYDREILRCLAVLRIKNAEDESKHRDDEILRAKTTILNVFHSMSKENEDDRSFSKIYSEAASKNEDIDVNLFICSKCDGDEIVGNDILICEHEGCYKAYHASCLNPPIPSTVNLQDLSEDWFCWQCESIDNSLNLVNSDMKTNVCNWRMLFPEVEARYNYFFRDT